MQGKASKKERELPSLCLRQDLRQKTAEQRGQGREFGKLAKAAAMAKDYRGRRR
jgi:hypothetical protein